jgi:hypothetical protein
MQDLVAGHIDLMFDQASNSLPQVRGSAIKAYAVTAKTRCLLRRMSPLVAPNGPARRGYECLLIGMKQTQCGHGRYF